MIEVLRYQREDRREPFTEWLHAVRGPRWKPQAGMRKLKGVVSDHEAEVAALRTMAAEAYGGLDAVATQAGISRESLYRTQMRARK